MNLTKSQAEQMQTRVDSKKGAGLCLKGSIATIKPKDKGKAKPSKKDSLEGLKLDNWIGSEDDFQIAVAKLLDASGLDWFHVPNGGKRNAREGAKFKRMGVKSGIPDVIIITPTKYNQVGMCIELKVGSNKPTDNQRFWEYRFYGKYNWGYELCYSIKSVEKVLQMHYDK